MYSKTEKTWLAGLVIGETDDKKIMTVQYPWAPFYICQNAFLRKLKEIPCIDSYKTGIIYELIVNF